MASSTTRTSTTTTTSEATTGDLESASSSSDASSDADDHQCPSEVNPPALGVDQTGTCGDGVVSNDEECDDGNRFGGDGCSADCEKESEQWTATLATLGMIATAPDNSVLAVGMENEPWGVGRIGSDGRVIDAVVRTPDDLPHTYTSQVAVHSDGSFVLGGKAVVRGQGEHVVAIAYEPNGTEKWRSALEAYPGIPGTLHAGAAGRTYVSSVDIYVDPGPTSVVHALDTQGKTLWTRTRLTPDGDDRMRWIILAIAESRTGQAWIAYSVQDLGAEDRSTEIVELEPSGEIVRRFNVEGPVDDIVLRADTHGQLYAVFRLFDHGYPPSGGFRLCRFPAEGIDAGAPACDEQWADPGRRFVPLELLLDGCGLIYFSYLRSHQSWNDLTPIWQHASAEVDALRVTDIGMGAKPLWSEKCSMNGGPPNSTAIARDGHLYHRHGRLLTQFWLR